MDSLSISSTRLSRVDGDTVFSYRNGDDSIRAVASVSGPFEARLAQELPSTATIEVIIRPLNGVAGTFEKELSNRIRQVFEKVLLLGYFPRTLVQIALQAQQGPSRTSSHQIVVSYLNAASGALLNAGSVPMRGVFCASLVSREKTGGALVVNGASSSNEEQSVGTFGFIFSGQSERGELVWADWQGAVSVAEMGSAIAKGHEGAREVYEGMRHHVVLAS